LRILKIGTLQSQDKVRINSILIQNITYTKSEVPFFDFESVAGEREPFLLGKSNANEPRNGEIFISFENCRLD